MSDRTTHQWDVFPKGFLTDAEGTSTGLIRLISLSSGLTCSG